MGRDGCEMQGGGSAVYAELRPIDRHRPFVDHLFVLRDHGRLTGAGRHLFASPFSEIGLVGRHLDPACADVGGVAAWKPFHLPPRFGRQPRRRRFHGWMVGVRCRPLGFDVAGPDPGRAALAALSAVFAVPRDEVGRGSLDLVINALDAWIESLRSYLSASAAPASWEMQAAAAFDRIFSGPEADPDHGARVASLAAAAGVVPRTLQRHFRKRTGLAPKRYAAVQRFSGVLSEVALGRGSLARIAAGAGYADQAHLTTDMGRHAGLSPGRFRALARRQIVPDAVRFFKDARLRDRIRLLVSDSGEADEEAANGEIHPKRSELRGARPDQFRASDRHGDVGH